MQSILNTALWGIPKTGAIRQVVVVVVVVAVVVVVVVAAAGFAEVIDPFLLKL